MEARWRLMEAVWRLVEADGSRMEAGGKQDGGRWASDAERADDHVWSSRAAAREAICLPSGPRGPKPLPTGCRKNHEGGGQEREVSGKGAGEGGGHEATRDRGGRVPPIGPGAALADECEGPSTCRAPLGDPAVDWCSGASDVGGVTGGVC